MNEEIEVKQTETSVAIAKYPEAIVLLREVHNSLVKVTNAYRELVKGLRGLGCVGRELTLILIYVGYSDQQASKLKQIVEAPEEVFQRYLAGVGMNATLLNIREGASSGSSGISSLPAAVVTSFESWVQSAAAGNSAVWRVGKTVVKSVAGWEVAVVVRRAKAEKKKAKIKGKAKRKGGVSAARKKVLASKKHSDSVPPAAGANV